MAGPVVVDVRRIEAWSGRRMVGPPRRVALTGGQVSPDVERITVPLDKGEIDLVAKRATPGEAVALGLLPADPVFPQLVDSGVDEYGPWIVTTYQPGGPIGWTSEPPPVVCKALARICRFSA